MRAALSKERLKTLEQTINLTAMRIAYSHNGDTIVAYQEYIDASKHKNISYDEFLWYIYNKINKEDGEMQVEQLPRHDYSNIAVNKAKAFDYLTDYEALALTILARDLAYKNKYENIFVNIGVGSGTSAIALREGDRNATIYSIDMRKGGSYGGLENERNAFENTGLKETIQILGDSCKVGRDWMMESSSIITPRKLVDLVFVDADHSLEGVTGDIVNWRDNIKANGIIVFHDYERKEWPDVKFVVDSMMKNKTKLFQVDTLVAYRI